MDEMTYTHPSYGQLEVSRCSSSGAHPLYGSSIKHRETLRVRLYSSTSKRSLSNNWYHPGHTMFEIEMSQSQWAEFISSIGNGGGIPCTIRFANGTRMDDPPFISERANSDTEFDATIKSVFDKLDQLLVEVDQLLGKPTVTKADRRRIKELLYSARQELMSNLAFVKDQFTEQMDKTVLSAKGEIEAYQQARMSEIALRIMALQQKADLAPGLSPLDVGESIESDGKEENRCGV